MKSSSIVGSAQVLVFANHDALSLDGKTCRPRRGWPFKYRLSSRRFDRLQTLLNTVTVVGTVFRAETFRKVDGFKDRFQFYQDMEIYSELVEQGGGGLRAGNHWSIP